MRETSSVGLSINHIHISLICNTYIWTKGPFRLNNVFKIFVGDNSWIINHFPEKIFNKLCGIFKGDLRFMCKESSSSKTRNRKSWFLPRMSCTSSWTHRRTWQFFALYSSILIQMTWENRWHGITKFSRPQDIIWWTCFLNWGSKYFLWHFS